MRRFSEVNLNFDTISKLQLTETTDIVFLKSCSHFYGVLGSRMCIQICHI